MAGREFQIASTGTFLTIYTSLCALRNNKFLLIEDVVEDLEELIVLDNENKELNKLSKKRREKKKILIEKVEEQSEKDSTVVGRANNNNNVSVYNNNSSSINEFYSFIQY
jgi:hypothetical protein